MKPALITADKLRAALNRPGHDAPQAQSLMRPLPDDIVAFPKRDGIPPKEAGVLVIVYPDAMGAAQVVLTRRAEHLRGHSGQISFPGGRREPGDDSFTATALRETCEELGLCAESDFQLLGTLAKVYIPPSHYDVYPTVAWLSAPPHCVPNPREVAEVFTLPLADLLDPRCKQHEVREIKGRPFDIPYYQVRGHKVWGATAAMLSDLEQRLRAVIPDY